MDSPQYLPNDQLRVNGEEPEDIGNLRPDSGTPLQTFGDTLIKVWMMSVPVDTVRLVTSKNVKFLSVWYLTTNKQKIPVVLVSE